MKSVAEFKRRLTVGAKLETVWHTAFSHRDENGIIQFTDLARGAREVSVVQTGQFALATEKKGEKVDSWCSYPKASMCEFKGEDTITIFEEDFRRGSETEGQPIPLLTYTFV